MPRHHDNGRHERGAAAEHRARLWLEQQGLHCLDAGWRCRLGELDLVMTDHTTLAFVEVRWRRAGSTIDALMSVDPHKQRRFARAAAAWLGRHPQQAVMPARFDVVAIDGDDIRWLRDAFTTTAW
ncbi:MAG: YraN family protein [Pseudomonadota bacterium]